MLLARQGHRVLLVDRATFPSDTLSTHYIHQTGVASLKRWGLLPQIAAAGAPAIRRYMLDTGPFALHGSPPPIDGVADGYSLRRIALDSMLVNAAAEAGAELRQQFPVDGLVREGARVVGIRSRGRTERARIVIGADGLGSVVARAVQAETYNDQGTLTCAYYTYWSGLDMEGVELYPRDGSMIVAAPTNDGQVITVVLWPRARFHEIRADVEGHFMRALAQAPELHARVGRATRADRFRGHHKDPILALGISDAFRDAELLAGAIDAGLTGHAALADALAAYERRRDELSAAGFQATVEYARLAPPPFVRQLWSALRDKPADRDRLFGTIAGTFPADEFFAPDNLARILAPPLSAAA
jgi:2-polyprenyl-6-methoxyphenol hydroxylase-like FAD-dependent oxidoreductase